jgi:hypothetical protein
LTQIPWNGKTNGGAQFFTDRGVVWVLSGTLSGSNVWRLDPRTLALTRLPLGGRMDELVAGEGQLWALAQTGKPRLYYVDVRNGYRLDEKRLPKGCGRIGHGHVVFGGRLWFYCDFDHVAVFDPKQRGPVKRFTPGGDLFAAAGGLWVLDIDDVLRCLQGRCKGRSFPVGTTGAWDTHGDVGWVLDDGATPPTGPLILVNFRSRAIVNFMPRLPRGLTTNRDLRVVGDEIWVENSPKLLIVRYSVNDPEAPPKLLKLPRLSKNAQPLGSIETGGGYAWLSVADGRSFKLFRATLPVDPLPLRRIRVALGRRFARALHVSCERAKRLYLAAPAYSCTVQFRNTTRYVCAALPAGRLAIDRMHKSCRR